MDNEIKEKIARNAACGWCRCYKCDGIIRLTKTKCDQDKLETCHQWYDGYRTALMALNDDRIPEMLKDNEYMNEEKEIMADAKIIQEKLAMYGYRWSVKKVIEFWEWLSDEHYSAGWLIPDSKTIEQAHKRGYVKEWLQKI